MLELEERQANTLRLVFADSIPRDEREIELIEGFKITGRPTTVRKDSRVFEFVWENYVTYCVTNETYALPDEQLPGEQKRISGDRVREYASSPFWNLSEARLGRAMNTRPRCVTGASAAIGKS